MNESVNVELLTAQVRALLRFVLDEADFPGRTELQNQAPSVIVTGGPLTMLDLRVTGPARASIFKDGPIPVSIVAVDQAGVSMGELLIWVTHGYLSALEFAWWSKESPDKLPALNGLQVVQK